MANVKRWARLCLGALSLAVACVAEREALSDRLIVPGERVGPVTAEVAESELVEQLGEAAVERREVQIGEGFCVPGTVLFPGTADAVEITWTDTTRTRPASAEVSIVGSGWSTAEGVRIGTTLEELAGLAGTPVRFSGFGWDYGGSAEWPQGAAGSGGAMLVLAPDAGSNERVRNDDRYTEIVGEQIITSDHPLIREMTIRVDRIAVRWGEAGPQRECR